jgi:uncharacterized repeat protein (TIGR01451 family)
MFFNVLMQDYVEKRYVMIKWIIIALLLTGSISEALAADSTQLQWGQGVSSKLYRDQIITYNGYSAKVVTFPPAVESDKYKDVPNEPVEPYVVLNISKDGKFINTTVLGIAESYVSPDGEVKITATGLPSQYATEWIFEKYNPWVNLEISPRGIPVLGISAETEENDYISSPSTEINAVITMENTGTADAINVNVKLDTELPIKRGDLNYQFDRIKKGETVTKTVTFSAPEVTEQKTVNITANISGYDVMDKFYNSEYETTVSISAEPQVRLSIRKSANEKVYLKDSTIISLSVSNPGKYDLKNVSITDSIPREFKLLNNLSLYWVVDIPAGGYWDYHYLIKPVTSNKNGIVLPSASADFRQNNEYYSMQSNRPKIIVYGPNIVITKKTDVSEVNPGDNITVTIVAENTGSTPTKAIINDTLPVSATLVSGVIWYEDYLEAGKKAAFSYTIKIDSTQPIRLPPAIAEYYELGTQGRKIRAVSQGQEIKIKPPQVIVTPEETQTPEIIATIVPTPEITTSEPTPVAPVPQKPEIEPPKRPNVIRMPNVSPQEVNTLLNFMLGCNDQNNDSRSTKVNLACTFYNLKNDSSGQ